MGAETEEAVVEALVDDLGDLYMLRVWMFWVEQVVPGMRDYCRRDARERRFQRGEPLVTYPLGNPLSFSPVCRQRMIEFPNSLAVRCRNLQQLIRVRYFLSRTLNELGLPTMLREATLPYKPRVFPGWSNAKKTSCRQSRPDLRDR